MVLSLNLSPLYLPLHVGYYLSWGNLDLYMRGSFRIYDQIHNLSRILSFKIIDNLSLIKEVKMVDHFLSLIFKSQWQTLLTSLIQHHFCCGIYITNIFQSCCGKMYELIHQIYVFSFSECVSLIQLKTHTLCEGGCIYLIQKIIIIGSNFRFSYIVTLSEMWKLR